MASAPQAMNGPTGSPDVSPPSKPLVGLADSLLHAIQSMETGGLKSGQHGSSDAFSLNQFWAEMANAFQQLSADATRLCVCTQPPAADEDTLQATADSIDSTVKIVASLLDVLPPRYGTALRRSTRDSVLGLIGALFSLVACIVGRRDSRPQQATGTVWEWAEKLDRIPKDNRSAVLARLNTTQELVVDALDEIEDARRQFDETNEDDRVEGEGEGDWTESDVALLVPCLGLIRASKGVVKTIVGNIEANDTTDCLENAEMIASLDDFDDLADKISPAVDNFVFALYPCVDRPTVMDLGCQLAAVLHGCVALSENSNLFVGYDQDRLEFLKTAINHNVDKIRNMTH